MTLNQLGFKLITSLANLKLTISCCESFTGGAFSNILTNVPGASLVFKGGYVVYSNEMKELIGIPKDLIEQYGPVSSQIAESMAKHTQQSLNTNFIVSFTGNAGPTAEYGGEVGVAFITIIFNEEQMTLKLDSSKLTREQFKNFAVEQALSILCKILA